MVLLAQQVSTTVIHSRDPSCVSSWLSPPPNNDFCSIRQPKKEAFLIHVVYIMREKLVLSKEGVQFSKVVLDRSWLAGESTLAVQTTGKLRGVLRVAIEKSPKPGDTKWRTSVVRYQSGSYGFK